MGIDPRLNELSPCKKHDANNVRERVFPTDRASSVNESRNREATAGLPGEVARF
jgi:hypothetical protein